jgi:hypothetical protein
LRWNPFVVLLEPSMKNASRWALNSWDLATGDGGFAPINSRSVGVLRPRDSNSIGETADPVASYRAAACGKMASPIERQLAPGPNADN